ncbi:methylated-DNA--[protein]-cysteine S-methyltransferase [Alicyclobacillus dauci]|uniref:Methylated-DNA--[protein]-cysteine S-methyltransferase n=1 Tax=Alicyclobacillus dauci TaxID=1475485 RepID=A0ABY6Z234_9BACL|nr:methylated-DNA--[protein]-cysteine S-methyltransferase [Alicyclobacillus dauci]WAH36573.1 methylated-DNA--[protein]-cysteine S-methyltransferase [Alicyclobacillus dauci]
MKVEELSFRTLHTRLGDFHLITCERGLTYAAWAISPELQEFVSAHKSGPTAQAYADAAERQLTDYLSGDLQEFSLPLVVEGTSFQRAVWDALCQIPYGETWSYRDVATHIGKPLAVRAVGQANRANGIAVVIPCHRVIGSSGALVGYAGSATDIKEQLLNIERPSAIVNG